MILDIHETMLRQVSGFSPFFSNYLCSDMQPVNHKLDWHDVSSTREYLVFRETLRQTFRESGIVKAKLIPLQFLSQ